MQECSNSLRDSPYIFIFSYQSLIYLSSARQYLSSWQGGFSWEVLVKICQSGKPEAVELYNCRNRSAALVNFDATWINQTVIPVQGLSKVEKHHVFNLCCFCLRLQVPQQVNPKNRAAPGGKDSNSFFRQLAAPQLKRFKWSKTKSGYPPSNTAPWTFHSQQVLPMSADLLRFMRLFVITVNLPQRLWTGDTSTIDSCVDDLKSK